MLTISKPLSASQAQTYHAKEFTSPNRIIGSKTTGLWASGMASWLKSSTSPAP
jgi:hypothetical protein